MADPARTAIQAAIRRASFAAHRDVAALDASALKNLERIYTEAAADIAARIRNHAGPGDTIAIQELRSVLDQVEGRLRELAGARDALLDQSLRKAAELGVRPYIAVPAAAVIAPAAAMAVAHETVQYVRSFIAADGLQLSDRIWRLDRGARDAIVNQIERSVIEGHGASQAALELLARGLPVTDDIAAKTRAASGTGIARDAEAALTRGEGSAHQHAMRVMRTEINRAHGEAYMKGGETVQGRAGWRYLLSPAHPKPDICDLLSTQNLYGLGPGVYPTREKTPWPAHPNTLSFTVVVFENEITEADRAGKEDTMAALARLTPEQRQGVLGKEKAGLYDEGKITRGMIRTPLRLVKKRLRIPLEESKP